jgi:hypothetical protein
MARISAAFGLFYVLQRNFDMRHYFNDVKVPKNSQDQYEFECLFICQHFTLFIFFKNDLNLCPKYGSPEIFEMGGVNLQKQIFFSTC